MRIAGKRYRTEIYMDCEQCGGNSHQVKFATDSHKICTTCEADTLRECKHCEKKKPLTAFSLDIAAIGQRRRACKACISEARRNKYRLGARCYCCNAKLTGEARGSDRRCATCPPATKPKQPRVISESFGDLLKRKWVRMVSAST